ncbi:MAG TPA: hypothetical protein V6C52_14230 [Coleofasciculaceae cyanobacterium]|jgi:hypothetical protein
MNPVLGGYNPYGGYVAAAPPGAPSQVFSNQDKQVPSGTSPQSAGIAAPNADPSSLMSMMLSIMSSMLQMLGTQQNPVSQQLPVDFNDNKSIEQKMSQINFNDPKLQDLTSQLVATQPESPKAVELEQQIAASTNGRPEHQKPVQQLFTLNAIRNLNNVSGSLTAPNTPEAASGLGRNAQISNVKKTLIQSYQQLGGT